MLVDRYINFNRYGRDDQRFHVEDTHPTVTEFLTQYVKQYPVEARESPWIKLYVTEFTVGNPPGRESYRQYEYISCVTSNVWTDGYFQSGLGGHFDKLPLGYELVRETNGREFRSFFRKKLN